MDEQEATEKLEEMVGSIDRCFHLMRIWQNADMAARDSSPWDSKRETKRQATERIFRSRAKHDGYSDSVINFYIVHIQ